MRMNVAQDGANRGNPRFFDPQWFSTVISAVRAARTAGLTVILSIQNAMRAARVEAIRDERLRLIRLPENIGLTRSLAAMYGVDGIRAVAICPGAVVPLPSIERT